MFGRSIGAKAQLLQKLAEHEVNVPRFITIARSSLESADAAAKVRRAFPTKRFVALRVSAEVPRDEQATLSSSQRRRVCVPREAAGKEAAQLSAHVREGGGSIMVQECVRTRAAGTMVTDAGCGVMVIRATFGLGANLASGAPSDTYVLAGTSAPVQTSIARGKRPLVLRGDRLVEDAPRDERVLSRSELGAIVDLGRRVARLADGPQEIAWGFAGETLYLLDAKPFTNQTYASVVSYDAAMVDERYSGFLLPLSLSFARRRYRDSITAILRNAGISASALSRHEEALASIVADFHGRLYLNENSVDLLVGLLPRFFQRLYDEAKPHTSVLAGARRRPPGVLARLRVWIALMVRLPRFRTIAWRYREAAKQHLVEAQALDLSKRRYTDLKALYAWLDRDVLSYFHLSMQADVLLRILVAYLRRYFSESEIKAVFTYESVYENQVHALARLTETLAEHEDLWQAVEQKDEARFRTALSRHPIARDYVKGYDAAYGGRFGAEMKLETPRSGESFTAFAQLLFLYRQAAADESQRHESKEPVRVPGETPWQRMLARYARRLATTRDELYLIEAQVMRELRALHRRVGELFVQHGKLSHAEDIWYLTHEEVWSHASLGGVPAYQKRIEERRAEAAAHRRREPQARFVSLNHAPPPLRMRSRRYDTRLLGIGAAAEHAVGRVFLVTQFALPSEPGQIITAAYLDAGSTPLIGIVGGVICERGDVLSPVACAGRSLGVPAVLSVEAATEVLESGVLVALDAQRGTVDVRDWGPHPPPSFRFARYDAQEEHGEPYAHAA